ncbi:MAG: SDR family oxidoreductase [Acidobacteria bacterium]|nr:SDR family oxidoreductase [Acidobacteriota bacterium]MBI3661815.1 SDR family oxidoreductase [Acidobacteriota bacterium]
MSIITGGGRGIGRAIAQRFAKEGAAVVVTARTAGEIEAVAGEIRSAGGRAAAVAADIAREDDCARIVAATREKFDRIDILVNNAGIFGPVKPAEEITAAEWDEALAINLRAAFLLARLVLPEMYARGSGTILNISSLAAKAAFAWEAPYAASKAGLLGLTRCLAAEAARKGVRVNAICPGPVFETNMSKELGLELSRRMGMDPKKQVEDFANTVLQGRGQTAEEIAAAAVFLVSSEASAITGQAVNVDGGMAFY